MTLLVALRTLADLALLLGIGALIAVPIGCPPAVLVMTLALGTACLTGAYALTARKTAARPQARRALPYLALAPALTPLAMPGAVPAGAALVVLAFVYLVLRVRRGSCEPGRDDALEAFGIYWKALLGMLVVCLVLDRPVLTSFEVALGATGLGSHLVLLRSLRHGPEVYGRPRYQLVSLACAGGVAALACVLGSRAFLDAGRAVLGALWGHVVAPLFQMLALAVAGAVWAVVQAVAWLASRMGVQGPQQQQAPQMGATDNPLLDLAQGQDGGELGQQVATALVVAAALAAGVLLVRWLARNAGASHGQGPADRAATGPTEAPGHRTPVGRGNAARVRRAYRRYLHACARDGVPLLRSTTSQDVLDAWLREGARGAGGEEAGTGGAGGTPGASREAGGTHGKDGAPVASRAPGASAAPERDAARLRELYLRARYDGAATRDDAHEAGRLAKRLS